MKGRAAIVLDVGKTLSKMSLWGPDGRLLERRSRVNEPADTPEYRGLDAVGIERWLTAGLSDFARIADVGAFVPVAHGAAAALLRGGALEQPPLDYEHPIPADVRQEYEAGREPFALTGSPSLPAGLNLGAQLHYLEVLRRGPFPADLTIVPWAQYWSGLLSGFPSADLTSLGCHTDLWYPQLGRPSRLSIERGWAARLGPLRASSSVLGVLRPEWAERTGLARDVNVYCGLHDSNAALLAARAFPEIVGHATVLSTGTWFVAMRILPTETSFDIASLSETRDCLVNVDPYGKPVPSARFMGGREIEILTSTAGFRVDAREHQAALLSALPAVLEGGTMLLPTFTPGCGPFPEGRGLWISPPENDLQRFAAVCLYAALMADACLDLIGARDRLLIEGRFAQCEVFARALASFRAGTSVYVARAESDASFGALRLLNSELRPATSLTRVVPLTGDFGEYRRRWHQEAGRVGN